MANEDSPLYGQPHTIDSGVDIASAPIEHHGAAHFGATAPPMPPQTQHYIVYPTNSRPTQIEEMEMEEPVIVVTTTQAVRREEKRGK